MGRSPVVEPSGVSSLLMMSLNMRREAKQCILTVRLPQPPVPIIGFYKAFRLS
jgi:hypothetical protein